LMKGSWLTAICRSCGMSFSAIKLLVAYRLFASESLENHRNT
jgi:hypothetical protein